MEIGLLLKLIGYAAGLVGVYVHLNMRLTKLEGRTETNKHNIAKVEDDVKELRYEKNTIQESINSLRLEIQQGFTEIKLELKDKADRADKK